MNNNSPDRPCRFDRFTKELDKYCSHSDHPKFPMAAVVIKKNRILGYGWNRMKSHPFQAKYRKNEDAIFLHAEVHAIKNTIRDNSLASLKGASMIVIRKTARGYGLAKPCVGCMRALVEFGIDTVHYSTNEGFVSLGSNNVFDEDSS